MNPPVSGTEEMAASKKTILSVAQLASACSQRQDFSVLLVESVSEVLTDLLGKRVMDAFYDHLERQYSISKDEIPQRLNDFLLILERTFGKAGPVVERRVAKKLYAKLGWEPEESLPKMIP